MKLELKHLSAYLPYGLKVGTDSGKVALLKNEGLRFFINIPYKGGMVNQSYEPKLLQNSDWKPILRPLSDLTKEIEHDGEKFVPIVELFQKAYFSIYNHNYDGSDFQFHTNGGYGVSCLETVLNNKYGYGFTVELPNWFRLSCNGDFLTIPNFEIYESLIKWHFDVFGLLDAGLAIDKNSLTNKENQP
jgi:hypothetical protein